MRFVRTTACLIILLISVGCRPSVEPDTPTTANTTPTPEAALAPAYSPEQIAAAKELMSDLGVLVKEDSGGHVVSIDTAANRSWVDDTQMQEILVFPRLTSLTVEGPSISDLLASRIAAQTMLTSLAMRNTLIGDQGLAKFTELKSLKIIDLRVSPLVTDAGMKSLAALPELRAVRLSGTNVSDAGVIALLDLARLTEIDVRNCRDVTKKGIEQLAQKKTLRTLKIGGSQIDDSVLDAVAAMTNLAVLSLDNCDISDAGITKLKALRLVDLTLYQCANVTDQGLGILAAYPELRRLTIRDVPAKGIALTKLSHPENLLSLNMAQSGVGDSEVGNLGRFKNLVILNLSETSVTDKSVEVLSKMKSLTKLVLTQTGVSEEGTKSLREALPDCSIESN